MLDEGHHTLEGIEKIVNIRASLNTGLSDELKEAFPNWEAVSIKNLGNSITNKRNNNSESSITNKRYYSTSLPLPQTLIVNSTTQRILFLCVRNAKIIILYYI